MTEGIELLQREDVRSRIELLDYQIDARLNRIACALDAPGSVDRPNQVFVGRREELRRLRHILTGRGTVGVITAVQGLSGIGKTALAHQYAYAYASEYLGGRWLVRCEKQDDLALALLQLATPLDIEFNDLEMRDTNLALQRVLKELERRTFTAAKDIEERVRAVRPLGDDKPSAGDLPWPTAPDPACLLILDNVNQPALLAPAQTARLPKAEWLHILATTRLSPDQLFEHKRDRQFLSLDELPEADALRLIERYQPGERFKSDADLEAARAIVQRIGGFTLAVEAVAVYLGINQEVTCEGFLQRLEAEGLLETYTVVTEEVDLVHCVDRRQNQLSAVLGPLLETLLPEERRVLAYAALLPPDSIPLPWLRALAEQDFPTLAQSKPGYPPQWTQLTRRLLGYRLLLATDDREKNGAARTVRMHRLLQEVVKSREGDVAEARENSLCAYITTRSEFFRDGGWKQQDTGWEIIPLADVMGMWIGRPDLPGAFLALQLAYPTLHELGYFREALRLSQQAITAIETCRPAMQPDLESYYGNHAAILASLGQFEDAKQYLQRAKAIQEHSWSNNHQRPELLDQLADIAPMMNRYMESLTQRPPHDLSQDHATTEVLQALGGLANVAEALRTNQTPAMAMHYVKLAINEMELGHLEEAKQLWQKSIDICALKVINEIYHTDPLLLMCYRGLAKVEEDLGNIQKAKRLLAKAATIDMSVLQIDDCLKESLNILISNNKETLEERRERMCTRIETSKNDLPPDHPKIAEEMRELAEIECSMGHTEEARQLCERAREIFEKKLPPISPHFAELYATMAAIDAKDGCPDEAQRWYLQAIAVHTQALPSTNPRLATLYMLL